MGNLSQMLGLVLAPNSSSAQGFFFSSLEPGEHPGEGNRFASFPPFVSSQGRERAQKEFKETLPGSAPSRAPPPPGPRPLLGPAPSRAPPLPGLGLSVLHFLKLCGTGGAGRAREHLPFVVLTWGPCSPGRIPPRTEYSGDTFRNQAPESQRE